MPFEFTIFSNGETLKAVISDMGVMVIVNPTGDYDIDGELALAELGFAPSVGIEIAELWKVISDEMGTLDQMLCEIESSGEVRHKWRGAWVGDQAYIYEFSTDEFIEHLGPVLKKWLEDDDGDAVRLARMLKAIRKKDGTGYEFDLSDGKLEEETRPELDRLWSGVTRTLDADGVELMSWTEDFQRDIWDPIFFESETDADREQGFEVAVSSELQPVLEALELSKKEDELDKKAEKDAPAPYHPESEKDGGVGVFYDYIEKSYEPKTYKETYERRRVVVPYYSLMDAREAIEISEAVIESCDLDYENPWTIEIVRRMTTAEEKTARDDRTRLIKEGESSDSVPSPFDPKVDGWLPYEEEDDE